MTKKKTTFYFLWHTYGFQWNFRFPFFFYSYFNFIFKCVGENECVLKMKSKLKNSQK